MTAIAVYYSHRQRYEAEFDTIEEALDFLNSGEDYGELSSEEVRDDGTAPKLFDDGSIEPGTVLKGDDLTTARRARERW